jgi:predicted ester cyclase
LIGIWRIECGRIVENWVEVDSIGRLQQLGVLPAFGGSSAATARREAPAAPPPASPAADCPATTEEENEALVRRWFDEAWAQPNIDNRDELLAPDLVHHRVLNRITTDAASRAETIRGWHEPMSDHAVRVDDVLTDGDLVLARLTLSGTHLGPWEDIAPAGKPVTWTGHTIFRIACGRIIEECSEADALAFFQQLGVPEWPPTAQASLAADQRRRHGRRQAPTLDAPCPNRGRIAMRDRHVDTLPRSLDATATPRRQMLIHCRIPTNRPAPGEPRDAAPE